MNQEKAAQEISFIKKVIAENRKVSYPNGIYFIIWGIAVFLGMIGNYFLIKTGNGSKLLIMWAAIVLLGWIYTVVESRREERKAEVESWADRLYGNLWLAAGVCMTVIGFSGPFSQVLTPMAICPMIGLIMGIGHFISGLLSDFKWQQTVGMLWWAGSILLLYWVQLENFFVFGLMMLLLHALPGFILNGYYKKS